MLSLVDFVTQLVGLMVELAGLFAADPAVVLESLCLILFDLLQLSLKACGLFAGQLSLGDTLIDSLVQMSLPSLYMMFSAFGAVASGRGWGVRALGHTG